MILNGEIAPGARLPAERELAEQMRVSRPTLREAVHVLEAVGLVQVRPGGGTYVAAKPVAFSPRILESMLRSDDGFLEELTETRREFESRNAELAAKNAAPQDLHEMEKCLQAMAADVKSGRSEIRHDFEFHMKVAESTRNRVRLFITASMLLANFEVLREVRTRLVRREPSVVEQFLREHQSVYAAIKERRAQKAGAAMLAHIKAAHERLPNVRPNLSSK